MTRELKGKRIGPARRKRGFTLLELMIAMTILGLSLTVILEVISSGTALGHDIHQTTEAILLTRWKINQMQIEGFPALGVKEGRFDDPYSGYNWVSNVRTTEDDNLRELQLQVKWRKGLREKEINMTTLLYNYGKRRKGLFF